MQRRDGQAGHSELESETRCEIKWTSEIFYKTEADAYCFSHTELSVFP